MATRILQSHSPHGGALNNLIQITWPKHFQIKFILGLDFIIQKCLRKHQLERKWCVEVSVKKFSNKNILSKKNA